MILMWWYKHEVHSHCVQFYLCIVRTSNLREKNTERKRMIGSLYVICALKLRKIALRVLQIVWCLTGGVREALVQPTLSDLAGKLQWLLDISNNNSICKREANFLQKLHDGLSQAPLPYMYPKLILELKYCALIPAQEKLIIRSITFKCKNYFFHLY